MPGKAEHSAQRNYLLNVLLPAIKAAKDGICELFFMDAAHFVQGGMPARVWSKVRMWVKTGSGRKRFNVLGALNFVTKKVETITNDTYIKSDSVVMMLEKLAVKYAGKAIRIILDNASYQRCELVVNIAHELNIELLFLPAYSPNLNLIERVWKFVKSKLLGASYIDAFADYSINISDFIDTLDSENSDKMNKLVSEKFQLFHDCHVLND
jgi:transposase